MFILYKHIIISVAIKSNVDIQTDLGGNWSVKFCIRNLIYQLAMIFIIMN